jgi:hypothetical protein
LKLETPIDFADLTYSKFLIFKNSARIYAAIPIQAVKFNMRKSNKTEGTKNELRIIRMYNLGIEPQISVNR